MSETAQHPSDTAEGDWVFAIPGTRLHIDPDRVEDGLVRLVLPDRSHKDFRAIADDLEYFREAIRKSEQRYAHSPKWVTPFPVEGKRRGTLGYYEVKAGHRPNVLEHIRHVLSQPAGPYDDPPRLVGYWEERVEGGVMAFAKFFNHTYKGD